MTLFYGHGLDRKDKVLSPSSVSRLGWVGSYCRATSGRGEGGWLGGLGPRLGSPAQAVDPPLPIPQGVSPNEPGGSVERFPRASGGDRTRLIKETHSESPPAKQGCGSERNSVKPKASAAALDRGGSYPHRHCDVVDMGCYHLAILDLAVGVILRFLFRIEANARNKCLSNCVSKCNRKSRLCNNNHEHLV